MTQSVAFPNAAFQELSVGCQQLLFENSMSSYDGHQQLLKGKK